MKIEKKHLLLSLCSLALLLTGCAKKDASLPDITESEAIIEEGEKRTQFMRNFPDAIRIHLDPSGGELDSIKIPGSISLDPYSAKGDALLDALEKDDAYIVYGIEGDALDDILTRLSDKGFSKVALMQGESVVQLDLQGMKKEESDMREVREEEISEEDIAVLNELINDLEQEKELKKERKETREIRLEELVDIYNPVELAGRESDTPWLSDETIFINHNKEREEKDGIPDAVIDGSVSSGISSMVVVAIDEKQEVMDTYRLRAFNPGDVDRKYRVMPKYDNIRAGKNTYLILAEKENGTIAISYTEIRGNKKHIESNRPVAENFCLLDICNIGGKPEYQSGSVLIQKSDYDIDGAKVELQYDTTKNWIQKIESSFGLREVTTVKKEGAYIKKHIGRGGCGGSETVQEIYDSKTKKPIERDALPNSLPKFYHLGNIVYDQPEIQFSYKESYEAIAYDSVSMAAILMKTKQGFTQPKENEYVSKKDKFLPSIILVNAGEGVLVKYSLKDSEWGDDLYSHKGYMSLPGYIAVPQGTRKKGDELSVEKTKQMMEKLYAYAPQYLYDKDGNDIRVDEIRQDQLPLLHSRSIGDGYDLILPANANTFQMVAEMCKPAIYIYDQQKRKGSVDLSFPQGGTTTKLIPDFTRKQGWDYQSLAYDKVGANGASFDYLYYAARVPGYGFEGDGWLVRGHDIQDFFDDMLPYLGFNQKENADFQAYRIAKFVPSHRYFVSFATAEKIDNYVDLDFSNEPSSVNRVIMEARQIKGDACLQTAKQYRPGTSMMKDQATLKKIREKTESREDSVLDVFERGGILVDNEGGSVVIQ